MAVKGYNFAPAMFLIEISTQCNFARVSFERLQAAAPAWREGATPDQSSDRMAPRDIMINCGAFLSAAGVISKILFAGKRTDTVVRRSARLRELLALEDLPHLRNLSVRNAFEHVDERLDRIFSKFNAGSVSPLSVTERPPEQGTLVLKRFDPGRMTVSYAEVELPLETCMDEIRHVKSRLNPAFKRLWGPKFDLWALSNKE